MAKRWRDAPSPCIDICKFKASGRCIGCSMTKPEKKAFKKLRAKSAKKIFFADLAARLEGMGRFNGWSRVYRRKCDRKEVPCPLDRLEQPAPSMDRKAA